MLNKSAQIEIALPENGFSRDFINALSDLCLKIDDLSESYLVLKKTDDDVSLLFGFLFEEDIASAVIESSMKNIMENILDLFSDDMPIDGIYLNDNDQLHKAMQSITSPFFKR